MLLAVWLSLNLNKSSENSSKKKSQEAENQTWAGGLGSTNTTSKQCRHPVAEFYFMVSIPDFSGDFSAQRFSDDLSALVAKLFPFFI